MILPTARWISGLALLGLLAPLASVTSAGLGLWLAANALWILGGLFDAVRVRRIDPSLLSVEREGGTALSVGRPLATWYHWRHPGASFAMLIRESPPEMFGDQPLEDRVLGLRAGRVTTEERALTPVRRGVADRWRFDVRISGPWRLARRQASLEPSWSTVVYPRLRDVAMKGLPSQSRVRREAGLRPVRRVGEGRLFESLREWVPGDDSRTIDWKASGRRGKLITRQYEDERRQRVVIALDAGRMLTAETADRPRLEYAIEAAALLAHRAIALDDDVGLMVFTDRIESYVSPRRGQRALRAIMDVLARVDGRLVEPNYPAAFAHLAAETRKRALTIVFTDVIDRFASDALVTQLAGLRPRHLPVAVTLRDITLERLTSSRAHGVEQAFERAAADELLQVRDDALVAMRSRGIVVVDADPRAAASAVVQQYLLLKRRALI